MWVTACVGAWGCSTRKGGMLAPLQQGPCQRGPVHDTCDGIVVS